VIQKRHYNPLIPGITHIPYAYCYRCAYNMTYPKCGLECVRWVEESLFRTTMPPEEVAAIFVEPIQGEGGYIVPPPGFHKRLHEIAAKYNILYVADEVQSGMGRTGRMFAMEHFGVAPDITAIAKGIASGLPLGAMVAKSDIMVWEAGSHASTFGGNPVSCAAALATIALLEDGLVRNAEERGAELMAGLRELQKFIECIGDVRGKGLMVAAELVKDRTSKAPAADWRNRLIQTAFEKGLLLLGCGESAVRFCPALTVSREEIDTCLSIFKDCLQEVAC
jgi:4-aminobutyrate aminotransferase